MWQPNFGLTACVLTVPIEIYVYINELTFRILCKLELIILRILLLWILNHQKTETHSIGSIRRESAPRSERRFLWVPACCKNSSLTLSSPKGLCMVQRRKLFAIWSLPIGQYVYLRILIGYRNCSDNKLISSPQSSSPGPSEPLKIK